MPPDAKSHFPPDAFYDMRIGLNWYGLSSGQV